MTIVFTPLFFEYAAIVIGVLLVAHIFGLILVESIELFEEAAEQLFQDVLKIHKYMKENK